MTCASISPSPYFNHLVIPRPFPLQTLRLELGMAWEQGYSGLYLECLNITSLQVLIQRYWGICNFSSFLSTLLVSLSPHSLLPTPLPLSPDALGSTATAPNVSGHPPHCVGLSNCIILHWQHPLHHSNCETFTITTLSKNLVYCWPALVPLTLSKLDLLHLWLAAIVTHCT